MAVAEYDRKLEEHHQKMAFGNELLAIVEAGATLKELQNSAAAAAKIAEKIEKVKSTGCELKQAVIEKRREVEQEIRSEFTAAIGQDREPDMDVVRDEMRRIHQEVAEKEKNCRKLTREKEHLQHDIKYLKVLKGIAPVHFDKSSTDTHVKGYITKATGELQVFEFNLETEDKCSVADTLWDSL